MPVCCTLPREHLEITYSISENEETFGNVEWINNKGANYHHGKVFFPAVSWNPYWNGHVSWSWTSPCSRTASFTIRTSSWSQELLQARCRGPLYWTWLPWFPWVNGNMEINFLQTFLYSYHHPRPHHHRRLHGHRELQAGYVHGGHPYYRYYYWGLKKSRWNKMVVKAWKVIIEI